MRQCIYGHWNVACSTKHRDANLLSCPPPPPERYGIPSLYLQDYGLRVADFGWDRFGNLDYTVPFDRECECELAPMAWATYMLQKQRQVDLEYNAHWAMIGIILAIVLVVLCIGLAGVYGWPVMRETL